MKQQLIERLTRYAKINTQSSEASHEVPTTKGQLELGQLLVEELKQIGMKDVAMDDNGYVMATLEATTDKSTPTIGFLAHTDTATDFTGEGVHPRVHENYSGGDIQLNETITLSPKQFPELANYVGHTLMTTDGTTLLGADDKAGIAEIVTAMAYLIDNPSIKHGKIRVAFTPDEEIGRGPHHFDVEAFNADFAYTLDGGPLGEFQYESFNAAAAKVCFQGVSTHPGTAKNKMVNAMKRAMEFNDQLPADEAPEFTEGYEGFYHLLSMKGDTDYAELHYIIRDFDRKVFANRKAKMESIVRQMQGKHGDHNVTLEIRDQYYNMREKIEPNPEIVDVALDAMKACEIEPIVGPIRGGTDGSQLSYKGLPTPNIFTGGQNYHGRYEYISVDDMEKAVQVIVNIAQIVEQRA
ncbi:MULTISPECIES: peptidase T [Shouchella]|uniref:Peptidase T n=2 Tax=Shouchella TaxID=2893057 RepID=A0ABY7WA01_9BACI|nr:MULTISPECIES: peptidase T [Shouchella]MED4126623.1 peptidase T [Shouchella miscanthi]WDF04675.1 peptidase T [Shouchella hunanensis]